MKPYSEDTTRGYNEAKAFFNETDKDVYSELEKINIVGACVLDIGSGGGKHAIAFKEMGAREVVGIDLSEDMIKEAQKNIQDLSISDVAFLRGSGDLLPFNDGKFELLFSNFVFHYFPNIKKAFEESYRVLTKGGHFVCIMNIATVEDGYEHLFNTYMPIRLGSGKKSVVVNNFIKSKKEILTAINESGFIIENQKILDHPNAVIDDEYEHKGRVKKEVVMFVLKKK